MPRRAPLPPGTDPREHPALKGGHVVILSGEAPLFDVTGPVGHTALGQILESKGLDYEPIHGKYEGKKQPGYIVHVRDDSEDETLKGIARRMGQESVVHSEGGKHQLVFLNGENKGKATAPASGLEWYGDNEPDDNYSTLYGASGEPLGHFKYNMDFDQPMVPDGPGPMVDVPEAAQQVLKSAVESYRGILLDLRKRETEKLAKAWSGHGKHKDDNKCGFCGSENTEEAVTTWGIKDGKSQCHQCRFAEADKAKELSNSTFDGRIAKYMTEGGRSSKVRGRKPSSDISTQGARAPSVPHSGNIVSKTETPMKLHDLMKSQGLRKGGSDLAAIRATPTRRSYPKADEGGWATGSPAAAILPPRQVRPNEKAPSAPGPVPPLADVRSQVASGQHPEVGPNYEDFNICDKCQQGIPSDAPIYQEGYSDDPVITLCPNCAPPRIHRQDQLATARAGRHQRDFQARSTADAQAQAQVGGEVNQALEGMQPAGGILKAETPMKLHDLMKSQASKCSSCGKPYANPVQQQLSSKHNVCGGCTDKNHRAAVGSVEHTLFEESDPKVLHPSDKKKVKKFGEEGFAPTNKFSNKLAAGREQSSAEGSPAAAGAKSTFTQRATTPSSPNAFKAEGSMGKAQCACGSKDCRYCGSSKPSPTPNEQGEHGGGPKKPAYQPGDETKKSEDMPMAPVVKNSIFKKMPEMNKAQTNASMSAQRNGGTIRSAKAPVAPGSRHPRNATAQKQPRIYRLGKQEFYIDHQNPTAPQKDDPSSSIPGGKETGWRNGGDKPKSIEHSASGGAISANKPKAGPDQKNTSENSVTEGAVPKSSGKNKLIEKAGDEGKAGEYCDSCDTKLTDKNIAPHGKRPATRCESCVIDAIDAHEHSRWAASWGVKHPDVKKSAEDFHKRTGGRFKKYEYDNGKCKECGAGLDDSGYCSRSNHDDDDKPEPSDAQGDEGLHDPQVFEKVAPSMGAPTAPSAGGAGSPTLSGGAPSKPPAAGRAAANKPFGKADSWVSTGASQYDPSIATPAAKKPTSGLFTKPELHQAPPGTGVTPMAAKPIKPPGAPGGFKSPAQHKGISGFLGKP